MSDPSLVQAPKDPWQKSTRDVWFFGTLAAATVSMTYLFSGFAATLLFAAVFVVVTWPLFERILRRVGNRRALAGALTLALIGALVLGPVSYLLFLFAREGIGVAQSGIAFVQGGELAAWVKWAVGLPAQAEQWLPHWLPSVIRDEVVDALVKAPEEVDVANAVAGPLQSGALSALNAAGTALPALISGTIGASIDAVIFLFAVLTLYIDGPRLLQVFKNLIPLDDAYEDRLFAVFSEISNNLVIGTILTAFAMAITAFVGYLIAGVDRALFFAVLTGLGSFVPIVGTGLVWIPVCVAVGFEHGVGWGLFLVGYNIVLTGNVDTFLRPMFMRGSTNIHPLLIFLAVLGGMGWMGLPGALVGPVIVAFFLALYTIYVQNYLGVLPAPTAGETPSLGAALQSARERLLAVVGRREAASNVPPAQTPTPAPAPPGAEPGPASRDSGSKAP